jgi:peptide/nickel transport system substrate-binding protein
MDAVTLQGMIDRVKAGRLSRRGFIKRMAAFGLTAPMATQILATGGVAMAATAPTYEPTKRGGGGTLRLLWWQGPTLLNPHFAVGTKDEDGSRLFYEPLARWDNDGNLAPVLAAEIPSRDNGGLAADGKSVIWKLKQGVKWHDGEPFTADDVVFTWEYAKDPATAATSSGSYSKVHVEKVDQYTVKVLFDKPEPFWADAYAGSHGCIIPKHLFEAYAGSKSRQAPNNLKPVGTGPYMFKSFNPGDLVQGVINPNYHEPNRPFFDAVEMKGGGDATSAARAVLQTAEYDFAWNLQVEDEILKKLEASGKGHATFVKGGNIEHLQVNFTDPWKEVDGERSSVKTQHPTLSDKVVREALSLLVNRGDVEQYIYGRTGTATANILNGPPRFVSKNTSYEFNVQKAIDLLEKGGWKPGADGVREKDGKKLKYVFQTSINQPRQSTQQIIKQACKKAGIEIELKAVTASVFFSSDTGSDDIFPKFYTDLQMYTSTLTQPDPSFFMRNFLSTEASSKANKWQGRNITRWRNEEYDRIYAETRNNLDAVSRAAQFIQLNDLVIKDIAVIPLIFRSSVSAAVNGLQAPQSGWDNDTSALADWYKEAKA